MTIKIEREALLTVLRQPPSSRRDCPYDDDECVSTSCGKGDGDYIFVAIPSDSYKSYATQYSFDDDSVTTASTADLDDKRVSFADSVVTSVWERPRTPREEISTLYYSCEDTQRFRQEYRLERKLLQELDVDPETYPVDDEHLSALLSSSHPPAVGRHRISRVVVLHNDKLETFLNPDEVKAPVGDDFFDSDSFWSGSITWY